MKKLILIVSLYFPVLIFSQQGNDFISWNESRKLVWDDFKASPLKIGDIAALTATHLAFSFNMTNGKVKFNIECQFEKNKSWGLVKNDAVLKHEQGHFDIAEMYARKLYKEMSAYQFNKNTFQKDLDSIYKNIVSEKEKYQQVYDNETNYSMNKNGQEEWLKKIEAELLLLKPWANYN